MAHDHDHNHHIDPVSDYVKTFLVLVVLMAATVFVATIELPWPALNIIFAMVIATIKAVFVITVFMGMRKVTKLTQVWAWAGVIFFLTLIAISLSDYFSRG